MKEDIRLIRRYFPIPRWIWMTMLAGVLCLVLSTALAVRSIRNPRLVSNSAKDEYTDFYGTNASAGQKVFLTISGITAEPVYEDRSRSYYVVTDEGVAAGDDWFYYLVSMNESVTAALDSQRNYYSGTDSEPQPFTLYGTAIIPSASVREAVMEAYDMTEEEYYATLGNNCLIVNDPDDSFYAVVGGLAVIAFLILIPLALFKLIQYHSRLSRTIRMLKQQDLLHEAAAELGASEFTERDPLLTENYVFNRATFTVSRLKDIWMVYNMNRKLYGISRYNVVQPLAGLNTSDGIHEQIICRLRQLNPELLEGYNSDNLYKLDRRLTQYGVNDNKTE